MTKLAYPAMVGFFVLAHGAAHAQTIDFYTFKVTPQEMALIGKALGQMPYADVASVIANLSRQMSEQGKAGAVTKPDDKPNPSTGE